MGYKIEHTSKVFRVSRPKLDRYATLISCGDIMEGKVPLSKLIQIRGIKMLITGGWGTGAGGWDAVDAIEAIPLQLYKGSLEPIEYGKHWDEVREGKRQRCYNGMKITIGSAEYVLTGPSYHFSPVEVDIQAKLSL